MCHCEGNPEDLSFNAPKKLKLPIKYDAAIVPRGGMEGFIKNASHIIRIAGTFY